MRGLVHVSRWREYHTQLMRKLVAEDSDSGTESSSQTLRKRHTCSKDSGEKWKEVIRDDRK